MTCTTLTQLTRMAAATYRKMGNNYSIEDYCPDSFLVVKSDDNGERTEYRVFPTAPRSCTCPFFTENYPVFGAQTTCKHLLFAEWELQIREMETQSCPPEDFDPYPDGGKF